MQKVWHNSGGERERERGPTSVLWIDSLHVCRGRVFLYYTSLHEGANAALPTVKLQA